MNSSASSSQPARLLLLETSGPGGWVAVAAGGELLAVRPLEQARRQARDLAPAVAELLAGRGWTPRQVRAVVVGRGPGSYTGLRVGLISAKAFAYAVGCPVVALDTFAVIAHQAPPEAEAVDVLADAQQGKVYAQRFRRTADGFAAATPLVIVPFEEWLSRGEGDAWVTGPGLRAVGGRLPEGVRAVAAEAWDPQPASVLHLGRRRLEAGDVADLWRLEPLYLRPSAAEEQWRRLGRE